MSRFSKIIDQLEELNEQDLQNYQQDLQNSSKVFAIAADMYERLQKLSQDDVQPKVALTPKKITKEFLIKTFGSYDQAYKAYQAAYGVKCRKGWKNLLALVKDLEVPQTNTLTVEERLENLENKVDILVEILLGNAEKTES